MWYSAGREMAGRLRAAGARHVAHLALVDAGPAWATFISTPRWLLTGRRDRFLRVFPPAGVSDDGFVAARRFGERLAAALRDGATEPIAAYDVSRELVLPDVVGRAVFSFWGRAIRRLSRPGQRRRLALVAGFGAWLTATVPLAVPALVAIAPLGRRLSDRALDELAPHGCLRAAVETHALV
jgi:hypothetical protein